MLLLIDNECPTSLFKNATSNEVQVNLDLIDGKTFKLVISILYYYHYHYITIIIIKIDTYLDGCIKEFTSKRKYKPPTIEVIGNK